MKKLMIAAALVAGGSLCLQEIGSAHGGTYRGPGDTVPPGGGGTGPGGGTPGTGGPSTPGPAGPSTPGPAGPGGPAGAPAGPRTPTSGGDSGPDLTLWQFWWGFNKEPYLQLKRAIHSGTVVTGSDDFFLGRNEKQQSRDSLRPSEESVRTKIVPALVEALKNERSNDIVTGAMVGLAKIGDAKGEGGTSEMAGYIKEKLTDPNQEIAETAALSLGILANEAKENIDILTYLVTNQGQKLRDEHKVALNGEIPVRTRAFAAYGLGLIGHQASDETRKTIVTTLVKFLDGDGRSLSQNDVPVGCLIALGLVPLPHDPSAPAVEVSKNVAKPAQVGNRQEQILWLFSYYADANNNFIMRGHVPISIARLLADTPNEYWLRGEVARRFMKDISKSSKESIEVQQSCILALGQIGDCDEDPLDAEIRASLMAVKDDLSDQQSRNFALVALAQVGGRPGKGAGDPLGAFKDKKTSPRMFLLDQLTKGKSGVKPWAGLALGVMERSLIDNKQASSPDTKVALRTALMEAKAPVEVGAYSIAVGIMKDQDSKEALQAKLDQISDNDARGYVAIGLGLMDDRGAIEKIQAIVKKSKYQPDLLKSAAIGLGLLGDKTIVDDLITMLGEATGLSSQAAISSALGFIGDARSIDPLIAMLKDKQKTDRARGFAAAALGIVADKEDLPWNTKISLNINYRANTTTLTSPSAGTGILDIL